MNIAIIDYGMGNIHSVAKAIGNSGALPQITDQKQVLAAADKIILPGVGAFDEAMEELQRLDLIGVIKEQIASKKPFLGICLGMQLLLEESQEAKKHKGLGVVQGQVVKFGAQRTLKVPHMGWNDLKVQAKKSPLLEGIASDAQVYFCHSYYAVPKDADVVAATCDYGVEFCCVLQKANLYGVQFHPEKSQAAGLKIIKNFVNLC